MTSLKHWLEEIADIPIKDGDGTWYDAETGFTYDDYVKECKNKRTPREEVSDQTKEYREIAKKFGGKSLRGTKRQKEWAEKIRAEKIQQVDEKAAKILAMSNVSYLNSAKFWIEARDLTGHFIAESFEKAFKIVKQANRAHGDERARLVEERNKILKNLNINEEK